MLNMKHGGHIQDEIQDPSLETPFAYLKPDVAADPRNQIPGDPAKVTADLKALGAAMVEAPPAAPGDPPAKANSTIPAVYTYWGQFIDHDMTANTDRASEVSDISVSPVVPADPEFVSANMKNLRRPTFDLDSVYGNGPGLYDDYYRPDPGPDDTGFYDGIRFRVGENATNEGIPGVMIPPEDDLSRDLPRIGPMLDACVITEDDLPDSLRNDPGHRTRPLIGDLRNDENLIVAQFHLAVLRFHNEVVNAIENSPYDFGLDADATDAERFKVARRLTRYHYQWLVINDYLKTVTLPGIVDKVLVGGNQHYEPLPDGALFAPLEYSVAAFRFGHTMVRGAYDHNRNFGRAVPPAPSRQTVARFEDLFLFTGNGHQIDDVDMTKSVRNPFRGLPTLPFNWIIEWDRMSSKVDSNPAHFARNLDTRLVDPIHNMVNEGTDANIQEDAGKPIRQLLRSLAQRNLLRGYGLSIPTGQALAAAMGVSVMTADELQEGNSDAVNQALADGGFLEHTPLWYYVLKEAEIRANGNSLGELGSRIVVETQVGLMRNDPGSYLNDSAGEWDPSKGVRLDNGTIGGDPIVTIRDFFAFAKLAA
jgi:Animal haem peroxidase